MSKDRRKNIRIPLLSESISWAREVDLIKVNNSKISDICKNGMFIESKEMPEIKEVIDLYIKLPSDLGVMQLKAKVVWRRWAVTKKSKLPLGFGIEITHDDPKKEKIMDSYTIYLRNKQIITVSKRIIEEFFGPRMPTDQGPTV